MICPNCNTENQNSAQYCRSCRKEISLMWWEKYSLIPYGTNGLKQTKIKLLRSIFFYFMLWIILFYVIGICVKSLFYQYDNDDSNIANSFFIFIDCHFLFV